MATPTLSMQTVSERQRKAAKKAWRTRRRRETPTAVQLEVLQALDRAGIQLEVRYSDWGANARWRYSLCKGIPRRKVTMTTVNTLVERGWVECVEKREVRDSCTHKADGPVWHWSRYVVWELSDKGRTAIEKGVAAHGKEASKEA